MEQEGAEGTSLGPSFCKHKPPGLPTGRQREKGVLWPLS